MNETTVNVGVVDVGLQSGGVFKIDIKKAPKGLDSRVSRYGQGTSLPTMGASKGTVIQAEGKVKKKFSMKSSDDRREGR